MGISESEIDRLYQAVKKDKSLMAETVNAYDPEVYLGRKIRLASDVMKHGYGILDCLGIAERILEKHKKDFDSYKLYKGCFG